MLLGLRSKHYPPSLCRHRYCQSLIFDQRRTPTFPGGSLVLNRLESC